MGKVACYNKKRVTVEKSHFISTENMRQNCNGIDFYNDSTTVDGIGFSENDILIANIRPYLKKAWEAEFDGACSTDVLSINPTNINADFLFHCIEKDDFFNYVMSAAKGSKMPRGDKQHIMEYAISFPSVPEQEKISAFIDLLTKMIAAQSKLVEPLKLYKRGVSEAIFSKKINFGCGNASWDFHTMDDLGYFYNGLSGKGKDDFGKGKSNLMYVVEMPVSIVKLDYDMSKAYFSSKKAKHVVKAVV